MINFLNFTFLHVSDAVGCQRPPDSHRQTAAAGRVECRQDQSRQPLHQPRLRVQQPTHHRDRGEKDHEADVGQEDPAGTYPPGYEVWDTAGQEKYRTLPLQYYRGIQGILLVYDISSLSSFLRIEDWFSKVEQNCSIEKLVLALVGNKLDLESKREVKA